MSKFITIYPEGSEGRKKLEKLCQQLTNHLTDITGWTFKVEETYFDYGQDWKWTTIICYKGSPKNSYQMLFPTQMETIMTSNETSWKWDKVLAELVGSTLIFYNKHKQFDESFHHFI